MIVIVGIGQLGGVFARGFLRLARPVVPVVRGQRMSDVAQAFAEPEMVLIAVAERDLPDVMADLPKAWRDRVALIQNELLPADWQQVGLMPTVMSVWFEKRKTFEPRVLRPSVAYGPHAGLLVEALAALDVPAEVLPSADALTFELVIKNIYILAKNAAGLEVGGTGRTLWAEHRPLAERLVAESLELQQALTGQTFDAALVVAKVEEGFAGGLDQKNAGRSAPARVERAVALADRLGCTVPTLRKIRAKS
ncbi:MAG: hypothetical protein AAFN74_11525 [Myxococcota bacterium]